MSNIEHVVYVGENNLNLKRGEIYCVICESGDACSVQPFYLPENGGLNIITDLKKYFIPLDIYKKKLIKERFNQNNNADS